MAEYNVQNEQMKKRYEEYLELDERLSDKSILTKIKDIRKYEEFTQFAGFERFRIETAKDFKEFYKNTVLSNGNKLGYSTISRTLLNLKEFFLWLSSQPKYRSKIKASAVRAFHLTTREMNIARAKGEKNVATLEQIYKVIESMPHGSELEKRNRALLAFTILTGARIQAIITFQIQHVDEYKGLIKQDARVVDTKFGKTFPTYFYPIKDEIKQVFLDWLKFLKEEKGFGLKDPLFPSVLAEYDSETCAFTKSNLSNKPIQSTTSVREVFKSAFFNAKMEYFNPHSFRDTLVRYGERLCKTPEEFKVWSQNLGHNSPLTTFTSYGEVPSYRQGEILASFTKGSD